MLDFESYSACDLKTAGLDNYARHPSTGVHCMAFAFDDEPVELWHSHMDPLEVNRHLDAGVLRHVREGGLVYAHNAPFEWAIWNHVMVPRYGWPELKIEQVRCTMAMAYAMGLPGALEAAAPTLGIPQRKDSVGKRIMLTWCKPKADGTFWRPEDDPPKFQALCDYCMQDVVVERALHHRLMELSPSEQTLWTLDHRINQRGVLVDLSSIDKAIRLVNDERRRLDQGMLKTTGGVVGSCTEVQLLVKWIRSQGVEVPGLAKADVLDALSGDLPANVRQALELRKEAAKSSTAKLAAMKERATSDGRVRGIHQFHGAGTGRWAGRGIQPQNLARPRATTRQKDIEDIFAHLDNRAYVDALYGPIMDAMADCIRGMIVAPPGKDLIACDFSAVEARVLAWLAGQDDVLDAFRNREDIYKLAASRIYRVPKEQVDKQQRQIGKVAVLACFAGGTQVLTNNGYKNIVGVLPNDLLWDGESWVSHDGVVAKGVRQTVSVDGIEVTPDHLIKTGPTWKQAKELASNGSTLSLALETGSENLPSLVSSGSNPEPARHPWSGFSVLAGLSRILCTTPIFAKGLLLDVMCALNGKRAIGGRIFGPMRLWFRMTAIEGVCSTAFQPASIAVTTPRTGGTSTTVPEAYGCTSRGVQTEGLFSNIWFRLKGGTSLDSNLTALMLTEVTNRATCDLSLRLKTKAISVALAPYSAASENLRPVFDILNSGPNNRFTIKSDTGHLLVHNCGYQGGIGAFQSMARNYNVKVKDEEADEIKVAWREAHPEIVRYWSSVEAAAILAMKIGGAVSAGPAGRQVVYKKAGSFLWCKLPSGRVLCYPYPELRTVTTSWGEDKEALTYMTVVSNIKAKILEDPHASGTWKRVATYGGSLVENVTQAVARDLLAEAMVRLETAGYPIHMHVHDEVVTEVTESVADFATKTEDRDLVRVESLMSEVPNWATGLPLAAEGWRGKRYRK